MGAIGFDNQKYLTTQSEQIKKRIHQFGGKLYLEFGGKLFDDYHASRAKKHLKLPLIPIIIMPFRQIFSREISTLTSQTKSGLEILHTFPLMKDGCMQPS